MKKIPFDPPLDILKDIGPSFKWFKNTKVHVMTLLGARCKNYTHMDKVTNNAAKKVLEEEITAKRLAIATTAAPPLNVQTPETRANMRKFKLKFDNIVLK